MTTGRADRDEAAAALLLTLADDEFVVGFWDSEWTGIAPFLEEDVAFSSLAQDEIGHARLFYEQLGALIGRDPDEIAFGRTADEYRHARLLDHPRTDWAFSVARRYLYETADALRLAALADGHLGPLADQVAKIRREERYHLMHVDAWLCRLAEAGGTARERLESALSVLWPDAGTVFTPLPGEERLIPDILDAPMTELHGRWLDSIEPALDRLGLVIPPAARVAPPADGRSRHSDAFRWLWSEFTSVKRLEPEAVW